MRSIDVHAHSTPQAFIRATTSGRQWHGLKLGSALDNPRNGWEPEQRIADMDSLGVDVQVVSTTAAFYRYDMDPAVTADTSVKLCGAVDGGGAALAFSGPGGLVYESRSRPLRLSPKRRSPRRAAAFAFWRARLGDLRLNVAALLQPVVEIGPEIANSLGYLEVRRRIGVAAHTRLPQPAF